MKRYRKVLIAFLMICSFAGKISADIYSEQQLIPAGHWVYDAMMFLTNYTAVTSFLNNAPLSVGELKLYLDHIPYDDLSASGKNLYQTIFDFLTIKKKTVDLGQVQFSMNLDLYPQAMYKSSSDLDWSFSSDYTGHKNSMDSLYAISDPLSLYLDEGISNISDYLTFDSAGNVSFQKRINYPIFKNEYNYTFYSSLTSREIFRKEHKYSDLYAVSEPGSLSDENLLYSKKKGKTYIASTNFSGTKIGQAFITIPVTIAWGDRLFMQADPCIAKSIWAESASGNFCNIPLSSSDVDFLWPRNVYTCAGKTFRDWGVNVSLARQGIQVGKTQTGSVIYNSIFETDFYFQFNVFCPRIKYNLDAVQISAGKFLYLHLIEARPFFKFLRLSVLEGTLIEQPFEIRYLNPLMIMHSFGAWNDYSNYMEEKIYGESHVAAYMGLQIELTPFRNFRTYILYAQNEIQSAAEKESANGKAMPDSFGAQLGFELTIPDDRHNGWWITTLEGVYTTPYLYIKQGADWSLYSERYNMQSNTDSPICSWIGTPFGPDALGFQARVGYSKPSKWSCEMDLLSLAHGTNSFGIFDNTVTINGEEYYAYYPSVLYRLGFLGAEEAANIARDYRLTGTVQFTNQITFKGSVRLGSHFELNAQGTYTFIFNNKNESGAFAQGAEIALALEYLLF